MGSEDSVFLKKNFWPWLIAGLTVLIYGYSLANGFIWDDRDYLPLPGSTVTLRSFFGFWEFSNAFSAFPLTVFLLRLQHLLWGGHPWGYHVISLTMHILNALLLFGFVRRIAPSLAGMTALLFAIHPIQVESVAWIAEQKNLWCFFFMMVALHSYLDFELKGQRKDYLKTILFFIAAMLCKCVAVCFSVVPLLYAWWQRGSISSKNIRRATSFVLIGLFFIARPMLNESIGASRYPLNLLFLERVVLAGKNFFFYVKQIVWPWKFLTAYPAWDLRVDRWWNWVFPVGVLWVYVGAYRVRHRLGRGAFVLLCFYGASIFPALGFFNVQLLSMTPAADHFSYLSVPPLLLMACAAARSLWRWNARVFSAWKLPLFLMKGFTIVGIAYLSVVSFLLTFSYKDPVWLWRRLFVERPDSFEANSFLGTACLSQSGWCDNDKAIFLLQRAHGMRSEDHSVQKALGIAYEQKGLFQPAVEMFLKASSGRDPFIQAYYFRKIGSMYLGKRDSVMALYYLEKAKELLAHPDYLKSRQWHLRMMEDFETGESSVLPLLGQAYLLSGDHKKAADTYRGAIAQTPTLVVSFSGLGEALEKLGDVPGARKAFQEAYRLAPGNKKAKVDLERILRVEGAEPK